MPSIRARALPILFVSTLALAQQNEIPVTGNKDSAFGFPKRKVKHSIKLEEIHKANPLWPDDPRDRIPAIFEPKIVDARKADSVLLGDDRIIGIVVDGHARAYPILFLQVHEVCNDTLGGRPIAATY